MGTQSGHSVGNIDLKHINQQIKLHDGRLLGYAEYGEFEGKPVFYFHGMHSSRLSGQLFDMAALRLNARVIAIDRPGTGLSDFKPGRKLIDWPDDVIELADALGIDRFAVIGISAGGPYSAACAFKIPERLTAVAIVSGVSPTNVPGVTPGSWERHRFSSLAIRFPWLMRLLLRMGDRHARRHPDRFISQFTANLAEQDREVFTRREVRQNFIDDVLEADRSGTRGVVWDMIVLSRPWGFRLQDLSTEIYLWHGELDRVVPPSMGRYMADVIPNCQAKFLVDDGHVSLIVNHIEEILGVLVS